jgi:hypothetical protein
MNSNRDVATNQVPLAFDVQSAHGLFDNLLQHWSIRLLVFVAFSTAVFWLQGWSPNLIQDHIFYFQNADSILAYFSSANPSHGLHQYWRGYSDNLLLSVALAYLHPITWDHVISSKIILWAETILYLCTFYVFTSLFISNTSSRVLISLLSSFFISYGPSFWGFTDFEATLSRSLAIPVQVLLLYVYFRFFDSWWRIWVFPAAAYSSLIHLSGFHLLGVLFVLEVLKIAACGWHVARFYILSYQFGASCLLTFAVLLHLANIPPRSCVNQFLPSLCFHPLPPYGGADTSIDPRKVAARSVVTVTANSNQGSGPELQHAPAMSLPEVLASVSSTPEHSPPHSMSANDTWSVEYSTERWRNFPPPASTILISCGSAGIIALLALSGALLQYCDGDGNLARPYTLFACATVIFSFVPQLLIFCLRHVMNIYPHNIEEFRSITFITIVFIYFFYQLLIRLYAAMPSRLGRVAQLTAISLFFLQPILVIRYMPRMWRVWIFDESQSFGILDSWNSPRTSYARQVLGLEAPSQRLYYACEDIVDWLLPRVDRNTLIISNRSELVLTGASVVGSSYSMITFAATSSERKDAQVLIMAIDKDFQRADYASLMQIGRSLAANYLIVPGKPLGAIHYGRFFAVIRVARSDRK